MDVSQASSTQLIPTAHHIYFGAIRKIKVDKGFGFIAGDDGSDYFFHWTGLLPKTKNFRDIVLQERVSFELVSTPKGQRAINVNVLPVD